MIFKKMIVVLRGYPRVDEIFIVQELVELERRGYEICLYSLVKPADNVLQKIHLELSANVQYVPRRKSQLWGALKWGLCHSLIDSLNLFSLYRSQAMVGDQTLKRLLQALWIAQDQVSSNSLSAKLVYSHFANAPSEVALGISEFLKLPWFVFAHAKDVYQTPKEILRARLQSACAIFSCNGEARNYLSQLHSNVKLIYHGIKSEHFVSSEIHQAENQALHLYSAGRLVPKKGHLFLINVLGQLKGRGHRFRYTLFGEGPERTKIEERIKHYALEDSVQLFGAYTLSELASHVRPGDIYLGAFMNEESGDRDGLPNTVLEAMYLQSVILSTHSEALGEAIEDGVNGYFLPMRASAWVDQILELAKVDTTPVRERARQTVLERFQFTDCVEELVQVISQY